MFIMVWSISALIGAIIALEALLLVLLWSLILFPFAFSTGFFLSMFIGVMGALSGDGSSANEMKQAGKIAVMPTAWAGRILGIIIGRISYYLSRNRSQRAAVALNGGRFEQRLHAAKQEEELAREAWVAADKKATRIMAHGIFDGGLEVHQTYETYCAAQANTQKILAQQKRDQGYASLALGTAIALDLVIILLAWSTLK